MKRSEGGNTLKETTSTAGNDKNHRSPQDDFEVEYKEFTVSEFLEIRKRAPSSSSKSTGKSDRAAEHDLHAPENFHIHKKKNIIFSIIILFFVLLCLFGAYSLIQYFLR